MNLDKAELAVLAKKLKDLECGAHFDEAMLLYPETEAWTATIGELCDRLRGGCTMDKLVKGDADESMPTSNLTRTKKLLEALCIEATEPQIAGAGGVENRIKFLNQLTDIALAVAGTATGDRLKEAITKDSRLLVAGSKACADLTAGEVNLFKRYPEIHSVVQAAKDFQEEDKPLRRKLQDAHDAIREAETLFEGIDGPEEVVDAEQLRMACASLEHSIGAFVSGAAEFQAIYGRDIEPWTATGTAAPLIGLGPLAKDVASRYGSLRQALQACSTLKSNYEELLKRHKSANEDGSFMVDLTTRGPASAKELRDRAAALQAVQEAGLAPDLLSTDRL